jgi:hypothetical protein
VRNQSLPLRVLVTFGLLLALIWPALYNRGPIWFSDTRYYVRAADAAVLKATHHSSEWTSSEDTSKAPQSTRDSMEPSVAPQHATTPPDIKTKGVMLGRSIYYALLLYLGAISGGFWLSILMQAGASLLAIYLVFRMLSLPIWPYLSYVALILSFSSGVSLFNSFLMPDLFDGISILACSALLSHRRKLAHLDYALWFLLLGISMLSHDTCTLVATLLLAVGIAQNLLRRSWGNRLGAAVILLAIISGVAGQALFAFVIKKTTGQQPLRYPLLIGRLIEDGPGEAYLRATCPGNGSVLCEYVPELPMTMEDFVFGLQPGKTAFAAALYDKRKAIDAAQTPFVLGVIRHNPLALFETSARNAAVLLFDFRLSDFRYTPELRQYMNQEFPQNALAQIHTTIAYRSALPIKTLTFVIYASTFGSLIYLGILSSGAIRGKPLSPQLKSLFGWIAAGALINIVTCATLSGEFARFEGRVVWLFPLITLLSLIPYESEAELHPVSGNSPA